MVWGHCWKLAPPCLINSRVEMAGFVNFHKVVVRRSAFSAFPSAWNGGESKGMEKSEELKRQFSQPEEDLNLQEIYKPISIPNKRAPKKKVVVVKEKNLEGEEVRKNWVDGEILYLTSLRGEIELD